MMSCSVPVQSVNLAVGAGFHSVRSLRTFALNRNLPFRVAIEKKIMKFSISTLLLIFASSFLLMAFSADKHYVISGNLAFLAGRYELLYTDEGTKATRKYAADMPDKYEVRITRKDQVFYYRNGKRVDKMEVWPGEIPYLDSAQYIAVRKSREIFPVFYSKDKIQVHTFPIEYNDNVFLRVESEE